MGKLPKNLAETRDRLKRDRERRDKRRQTYERKLKRLVERMQFATYADEVSERFTLFKSTLQVLNERREAYKKGFRRFIYDLIYNKILSARRRIVSSMRKLQLAYDMWKGYIPIITKFVGHKIELYVDEKIEEFLSKPEYIEATRDALTIIFSDILRHRYRIVMKPEDLERLKGILAFLYERYYAPFRERPCQESKYIVRLTPVTFWVFKNQPVRLYVLRYVRINALHNYYTVMVTKPIDIMLNELRVRKPREEVTPLSSIAGDTPMLTGNEDIALSRDENRDPRRLLKAYVAMALPHRVRDAFARQLGIRDRVGDVGHCSVYVGLRYDSIYKKEKEVDYWYKRRYRAIMAW